MVVAVMHRIGPKRWWPYDRPCRPSCVIYPSTLLKTSTWLYWFFCIWHPWVSWLTYDWTWLYCTLSREDLAWWVSLCLRVAFGHLAFHSNVQKSLIIPLIWWLNLHCCHPLRCYKRFREHRVFWEIRWFFLKCRHGGAQRRRWHFYKQAVVVRRGRILPWPPPSRCRWANPDCHKDHRSTSSSNRLAGFEAYLSLFVAGRWSIPCRLIGFQFHFVFGRGEIQIRPIEQKGSLAARVFLVDDDEVIPPKNKIICHVI